MSNLFNNTSQGKFQPQMSQLIGLVVLVIVAIGFGIGVMIAKKNEHPGAVDFNQLKEAQQHQQELMWGPQKR